MFYEGCFEITDQCQCNCIHCSSNYDAHTFIPIEILKRAILDFREIGGKVIELSGGDPTEHPNFEDILSYARDNIKRVIVFSNNTHFDNEYFANLLKKYNAELSFTILGERDTHNNLMGKDIYDKTLDLYRLCKKYGIKVHGHYVVMKPNYKEYLSAIKTFPSLKALRLMPQGRAYDNWDILALSNGELKEFTSFATRMGNHLTLPFCYQGYCNAGISQFLVTPLGTVVPCASFKRYGIKLGNIYEESLKYILSPSNKRLVTWKRMKSLFMKNSDLNSSNTTLYNATCWGHYLHDGMKHPLSFSNMVKEFDVFDGDYSKWIEYPENRIYISGSHGVGKSTLINDLAEEFCIKKYDNEKKNPNKKDVYRRQLWRLYKYKYDDERLRSLSGKYVVVDRCNIDWIIYTKTFHTLGWLSDQEYQRLMNRYYQLFGGIIIPKYIVFINPPIEWSKERIWERWNETGIKWREDDFTYYDTLRKTYDQFLLRFSDHIIEIKETERKKRIEKIAHIISYP